MADRCTGTAGYQDPLISIRAGTLAIRRYYFPTGTKRIRLAAITGVERRLPALAATALLFLAGCTAPPRTASGSAAAAPSTSAPTARPARARLHGRVAFAADRQRNVDLYLLELPGGRWRRLTTSPGADLSPTWAPDGRRLAFRSDRDGDDEVYVMNADGSRQHNLTRNPASDYSPAWSPDGRRIVLDSSLDQDPGGVSSCGDLFVVDADDSHLTRLTDGPARDCGPSFTPDGRHIMFFSDRAEPGGDSDLYVMNLDGSAVTRLTHADSEEQEPAFTPCEGACP
jgi:dipeptidyl aminopeptidase/acylaminoacyl peptidase